MTLGVRAEDIFRLIKAVNESVEIEHQESRNLRKGTRRLTSMTRREECCGLRDAHASARPLNQSGLLMPLQARVHEEANDGQGGMIASLRHCNETMQGFNAALL